MNIYKDICDGFGIGIIRHDTSGKIIEANAEASNILNQSQKEIMSARSVFWKAKDESGNSIARKNHPVLQAIRRRKKITGSIAISGGMKGKTIWLKLQIVPQIEKGSKSISSYISSFQNITEQISSEEKLSRNIERLNILVNEGADSIFLANMEGKIIDANQHACKSLGYTRKELLSMKVIDLDADVPNEKELKKFWSTLKIGVPVTFQGTLRKKNNDTIPVEIRATRLRIGDEEFILGFSRDITERLQLEESLIRFKSAVDSSMNAVGMSTPEGKHVYQNKAFDKLFGDIGDDPPSSVYVDEQVGREVFTTIMNGGDWNGEVKMYGRKRQILSVLLHAYSLKDSNNMVTGLVGVHLDLTAMRKAERELFEKEKLYRQLLDNLSDAVFFHPFSDSKLTKFIEVNEAACKRYGYTHEEFLKISPKEITAKNYKLDPNAVQVAEILREKNNLIFERENVTKSGETFPVEVNASLIEINNNKYILSVVRDISERKNSEHRQKILQQGIDRSMISVFQLNDDGRIYYANENACTSLGYSRDELLKLSVFDIDPTFDIKKWKTHRARTRKNRVSTIEAIHRRKDGTEFPVEITINFVEIDGKSLSFSFAKDITERKKAIAAIRKQNREYLKLNREYEAQNKELMVSLKQIQKINSELNIAKARAEESDRLKTAFLANMSHEIRTPMNGILGFADLLTEPDNSPEMQQKYIKIIQQSGKRMLKIINDLIDVAKIEAGQVELKFEETNLNELFDSLFNFFLPEAKLRNLGLSYRKDMTDKESIFLTDSTKLNQILTNFIKNALKFTDQGQISFGYALRNNTIEFYIEDTGIGISKELRRRIFERFTQGGHSNVGTYEGAGLGLAISKAYIELLGGKIHVSSTMGKGSVFSFTLPYKTSTQNSVLIKDSPATVPLEQKDLTVLVVEDDEVSYMLIKNILKKRRHKIIWVDNGEKAIDIVNSDEQIDIVLMDLRLPVLNGFDATRKIKEIRPDLPVIAQTAFASSNDQELALNSGCDDYISKPIHSPLLLEKINLLTID